MRVSAVQMSLMDEKRYNLEKALIFIEKSAMCDLIVLPEMLMGKRSEGVELYHMAEDVVEGDFAKTLRKSAIENKIDVCTCLWEDSGTDKVYNTAMVYGADGTIKAKYRKLHLFDALSVKESDFMLKGESLPPIFESGGIKCGLSICYDLRFPEIYRHLVMGGAQLFVTPAAWYAGDMKIQHLHTLLSARAIENTTYSICSNLCNGEFCGNSAIFAPFGEMLSTIEKQEGVILAEIDVQYMNMIRAKLPCLDNIRSDVFYS